MNPLMKKVKTEVKVEQWFSFKTDIWSTMISNDSLISVTAHWISDYLSNSAVLHVQSFHESHNRENICTMIDH